jgi:two-component system sensor histidine kinase HydH
MKIQVEGKRIGLITFFIIVISFLHYFTSIQLPHFHAIYANAYYIPIILAAFWFGLRGGLITSVSISIIYLPHVVFQWGGGLENLSRFLEIVMFNVVGSLVGLMVQREREQRKKYQQAAQELKQSYQQLEKQTETLLEMEDQLRTMDRLAVMGELSASLAHEVRNPLGSIRGTVDILRKEFSGGSKQIEFFNILVKEVNRLNQVVENYLGLSKPKRQRMIDRDLMDIVQSVLDLVSVKARKERIDLILVKPSQTITVFTDETLLRQVLLNILLNAMASIEQSGRVVISPSLEKGGSGSETSNQLFARIRISDTGVGIADADVEKVFKPFYSTKSEGTGLGLAIAKRAIQQLSGEINLESKEKVGTTVTILIPCAEEVVKDRWKKSSS